ncbi:MAG: AMP-binding protein [Dehalococcoidales bacterium]|nr:AMP-binding protein [Dehalococcoidales bacterium]
MAIAQGRYFDSQETVDPDQREKYQRQKLIETVEHAYLHSSAARNLLDFVGLKPSPDLTVEDLDKLPITRKTDLIEMQKVKPPFGGLLTIPEDEIERIFVSPGPIYEYQPSGIQWFARSFHAAGFGRGDIVVNTFTYHMSPAGMLFHESLRQVGATVVVMGTGNTDILIKAMLDLKVTGFLGTPTFLMSVIKKIEEMGYELNRDFALKKAWFTGEMLPQSLRKVFEENYQISTYQAYAVTEPGGAIAYECSEKVGMHLMEDYIVEIVDPITGKQLDPGQVGEIVVTPIHNRTWGLIRFGTGDMSSLITAPCTCGRTSYRISGIVGRTGDAVKVRGMFIVARQAEQIFSGFEQVSLFQIVVDRVDDRDEMHVKIELKDEPVDRNHLADEISDKIQSLCRIRPDSVQYVEPGTIPESHKIIEDVRKWE